MSKAVTGLGTAVDGDGDDVVVAADVVIDIDGSFSVAVEHLGHRAHVDDLAWLALRAGQCNCELA